MRCLYCGVELALLKKLAGSENFCSDAHRLAYQEEFSRLALNRLLQANPQAEKKSPFPLRVLKTEPGTEDEVPVPVRVSARAGAVRDRKSVV